MSSERMRRGIALIAASASLAASVVGGAGVANAQVAANEECSSASIEGPPVSNPRNYISSSSASSGTLRVCWYTHGSFGEGQVSFGGSVIRDDAADGRRSELWVRVISNAGTRNVLIAEALTYGSWSEPPRTVSIPTVGAVRVDGAACTSNAGSSRKCGRWVIAFDSSQYR